MLFAVAELFVVFDRMHGSAPANTDVCDLTTLSPLSGDGDSASGSNDTVEERRKPRKSK